MENNSIPRALKALHDGINNSSFTNGEKNAMLKLLELLVTYYETRLNEIMKSTNRDEVIKRRIAVFTSQMTDYIVALNDTLKEKNDPHSVVSFIHREINYDEKKGIFKRRRLI